MWEGNPQAMENCYKFSPVNVVSVIVQTLIRVEVMYAVFKYFN